MIAYIFGKGGHAKVIRSFIESKYHSITYLDKAEEQKVWDKPAQFRDAHFYLGIGDNDIRSALFQRAREAGLTLPVCIAPNAFVAQDVKIGEAVFIGAGACILTAAQLGDNVIVNTLSSVDHDCHIGPHSQLTAGVNLGGGTRIGMSCFFGIKSITLPMVTVGDSVQVMAGSVINKDVESNLVVGGYPAKIIKQVGQ